MMIYLSNALDEVTKLERLITTDSPAATKKVFGLCHALKAAGINTVILSLGRGRQNGSGTKFSSFDKEVDGIYIMYASFWHVPFITHIITALSLMLMTRRLVRKEKSVLLVYNRCWHYIPALCVAKLLSMRCFLDLEDGWIDREISSQKFLTTFFDWACDAGSVLACDTLEEQVKTTKNITCYGSATSPALAENQWHGEKLQVLFGGSLWQGTGVDLFIQGVRLLMEKSPPIQGDLHINVVGFGGMAKDIAAIARAETNGLVEFHGSVSNFEYRQLLGESHIGLCLKLSQGPFHTSTFPSKVIELASHGLLLVSTQVSDVPKIFSSQEALLLPDETPESLADALFWAATHRDEACLMAKKGREAVLRRCAPERVGAELARFLAGDNFK